MSFSDEEEIIKAEHILSERLSKSDKVEQLTVTATTIHRILSRLKSDELASKLLSKYRDVQLRISALQAAAGHFLLAINALDRAIIVGGHDENFLEMIKALEKRYWGTETFNATQFPPTMCLDVIGTNATVAGLALPRVTSLTLKTFSKVSGFPFIFENFAEGWPACHTWKNPAHFLEYCHRLVPVEIGLSYHDSDWRQAIVPFGEFLMTFVEPPSRTQLMYLAQYDLISQLPKLESEIASPQLLTSLSSVVYRNFWFGMAGCHTPLHSDPYDNFFVQVVGRKQFILVDPYALSAKWASRYRSGGISMLCLSLESLSVPFYSVVLGSGDMLFIPKGWWHAVESLSDNISVSFWV